jgi:hypothetical protein
MACDSNPADLSNPDGTPLGDDEDSMVRFLAPLLSETCVAAVRQPYLHRCRRMADAERLADDGHFVWVMGYVRDHLDQLPWSCLASSLRRRHVPAPLLASVEKAFRRPGSPVKRGLGQLGRLLREHQLVDQVDRPWRSRFPDTPLIRYRSEVLVACSSVTQARRVRSDLRTLIIDGEIAQRVTPRLAIRHIADDPARFAGLRVEFGLMELEWRLGEQVWRRLDRLLARARRGPDPYKLACRAVAGWIMLAGPAYRLTNMGVALGRVEDAMRRMGAGPLPHRRTLRDFWAIAHLQWMRIRLRNNPPGEPA